jgi:hypothetical protein
MSLRDNTFESVLRDDLIVKKWLSQLLTIVSSTSTASSGSAGSLPSGPTSNAGISMGSLMSDGGGLSF